MSMHFTCEYKKQCYSDPITLITVITVITVITLITLISVITAIDHTDHCDHSDHTDHTDLCDHCDWITVIRLVAHKHIRCSVLDQSQLTSTTLKPRHIKCNLQRLCLRHDQQQQLNWTP